MILDTCALLWLSQGGGKLSTSVRKLIAEEPEVFVLAISGLEIGTKYHRGRLVLPAQPEEWFATELEHHDLQVIPLTLALCLAASRLPSIHKDPFDRLIIATAKEQQLVVVTGDPVFGQYGVTTIC